jgi:hypothetical protein
MAVVRSSAAWTLALVWAARSMSSSFCWISGVSSHWAMVVTEVSNMSAMSGRVKRVERMAEKRADSSVFLGRGWVDGAPPWFEVGWEALTRGLVSGTWCSVLFVAIIMECMMGDRRVIARGVVGWGADVRARRGEGVEKCHRSRSDFGGTGFVLLWLLAASMAHGYEQSFRLRGGFWWVWSGGGGLRPSPPATDDQAFSLLSGWKPDPLGSTDQRTGQWHWGGIRTPSALRGLGHLARWERGRVGLAC